MGITQIFQIISYLPLVFRTALEIYRLIKDSKLITPEGRQRLSDAITGAPKEDQLKVLLDEMRKLRFEVEKIKSAQKEACPKL
jgi:hypothetical protein